MQTRLYSPQKLLETADGEIAIGYHEPGVVGVVLWVSCLCGPDGQALECIDALAGTR